MSYRKYPPECVNIPTPLPRLEVEVAGLHPPLSMALFHFTASYCCLVLVVIRLRLIYDNLPKVLVYLGILSLQQTICCAVNCIASELSKVMRNKINVIITVVHKKVLKVIGCHTGRWRRIRT